MRNQRTLVAAGVAALLGATSVVVMLVRQPADAPAAVWRVTSLKDGVPVQTVEIDCELPGEPSELFGNTSSGPDNSFLMERLPAPMQAAGPACFSPNRLPPAQRRVAEFLLLLPAATLLVCLFRNVVGLNSFGTFAPALLGLAFREIHALAGVAVVVAVLVVGGLLRRGLSRFHLLQVPRAALLLSLVCLMLLFVVAESTGEWTGGRAVALLPLVILTGMIERFWLMDEEDGSASSVRTLATTLGIAMCVWLLASVPTVGRLLIRHPETLGLIIAGQLLLGRYTGLRLLELYRFRALVDAPSSRGVAMNSSPQLHRMR